MLWLLIRIWIRIQGGQKWPTKNRKQLIKFIFCSVGRSLLRAEGFSCSLDVLYEGLGISKLQFLIKKQILSAVCFFSILGHQTWIRIQNRIRIPLKCWNQIRNKWIGIYTIRDLYRLSHVYMAIDQLTTKNGQLYHLMVMGLEKEICNRSEHSAGSQ